MSSVKYILLLSVGLLGCVEPYDFQVEETVEVLVVEAEFSNELTNHQVKLSISRTLDEEQTIPLSGATVWVIEDGSNQIDFTEKENGIYETEPNVSGKVGSTYVLGVELQDGTVIQSTQEVLTKSVAIDSVWGRYIELLSEENSDIIRGVQLFVNTHDPNSEASFYRYEYVEDFEVKVPFPSVFEWYEDTETYGLRETSIGTCYEHAESEGLIVTTTSGLSENRLSEFPIRMIEDSDYELSGKYSLVLKQYSLSPSAYQYYKNLKESNESAGSFFDKQKGTIAGNMSPIDDSDIPVLGYFEVAGVSSDTAFFSASDFSNQGLRLDSYFRGSCSLDDDIISISISSLNNAIMNGRNIISFPTGTGEARLTSVRCSDCRVYADIKKPDYWD